MALSLPIRGCHNGASVARWSTQIEELKKKYTDKYVVVDKERPELARFRDTYGTVKTVNMSGRALVEFADYHLNIGWYDIDPMFLRWSISRRPQGEGSPARESPRRQEARRRAARRPGNPPPSQPRPANNPSPTSSPPPRRRCRQARSGESASAGRKARRRPETSRHAAAKVDRSKMSVADMLAAARAGKGGAAKPAAAPVASRRSPIGAPPKKPRKKLAEAPAPAAPSGEKIDKKSKMTIDQMCDWCRVQRARREIDTGHTGVGAIRLTPSHEKCRLLLRLANVDLLPVDVFLIVLAFTNDLASLGFIFLRHEHLRRRPAHPRGSPPSPAPDIVDLMPASSSAATITPASSSFSAVATTTTCSGCSGLLAIE